MPAVRPAGPPPMIKTSCNQPPFGRETGAPSPGPEPAGPRRLGSPARSRGIPDAKRGRRRGQAGEALCYVAGSESTPAARGGAMEFPQSILEETLEAWRDVRNGVVDEVRNLPAMSFDFRPTPRGARCASWRPAG